MGHLTGQRAIANIFHTYDNFTFGAKFKKLILFSITYLILHPLKIRLIKNVSIPSVHTNNLII